MYRCPVTRCLTLVIILSTLSFSAISKERLVFSSLKGIDAVEEVLIMLQEPTLVSVPFYHDLYKKHAALVPDLIKSINNMKQQGQFRQIYHNYIEHHYPLP